VATRVGVPPSLATLPRPLTRRATLAARAAGAPTDLLVAVVIPRDAPLASVQTDAIPALPRKRFGAAVANPPDVARTSTPTGMIPALPRKLPAAAVADPLGAALTSAPAGTIPTFPQKLSAVAAASPPDVALASAPVGAIPTLPRKRPTFRAVNSTSSAQIAPIRPPVRQTPPTRHPATRGPARKNDAVRALANCAKGTEVLAVKPATAVPPGAAETTNVARGAPRAIHAAAPAAATPRPAGLGPLSARAARARQKIRSPHAPARATVAPALQAIVRRKRASAYRRCSRAPA